MVNGLLFHMKLQGGQIYEVQYSLIPLNGPYSYCTTICKGAAGRMICLAGRRLPTPALPFTFISYIRQLVAQELVDKRIHVLYGRTFCRRLASEVGVLEQTLCLASIELVLVYIRSV